MTTAETPKRLRLSRAKGARLPAGAVNCARPGKWGNRFKAGEWCHHPVTGERLFVADRAMAVALHRIETEHWLARHPDLLDELRGRDCACWCQPDEPCHVDNYLDLANQPRGAAS